MSARRAGMLLWCAACGGQGHAAQSGPPVLQPQQSGVTVVLQSVSAPSAQVVWVGGHQGVLLRTIDGGTRWTQVPAPGGDSLQWRDVHALDADTAWILAAGPGTRSRIYATRDGGRMWLPQFINTDSSAFFDCFAFWDARRAVAFSDAVEGQFVVLVTDDGGAGWRRVPDDALPRAQPGEGSFAASGACVTAWGGSLGWIGTGAADTARVLRTADAGRTWRAAVVPVPGGNFAGLAAVVFRDSLHGAALGGDLGDPKATGPNVARSEDGGRTWLPAPRTSFPGAVYGAGFVPGTVELVAVGPGGMAWSADGGQAWVTLDSLGWWSVGFAPGGTVGWAVGPNGRIARLARP